MAISGDVIAQDGGQAKLHPYLVALVRWCVSYVWSTATVLLHRLMITPVPQITGSSPKPLKARPASRDHLHPEPRVECVVLHQPEHHGLDVIFVHGLYGSLGNTWRQGEWRSKYHVGPEKSHLRRPAASPSPCSCSQCQTEINKGNNEQNRNNNRQNTNHNEQNRNNIEQDSNNIEQNRNDNELNRNNSEQNSFNKNTFNYENKMSFYEQDHFENGFNNMNNYKNAFRNIDEKFYSNFEKILPQDDVFITEKFYNNTLLDQVEIIDNYETQAQFVSDLFKNCNRNCENSNNNKKMTNENNNEQNINNNEQNGNNNEQNRNNKNSFEHCTCEKDCEVGCGCICDDCYSPCWPRDWIKLDYPEARVISINYTSDPHLWRPLWIKESKRLCLHERAKQMTEQLLALGVGEKPVVWVGHSKGGLFIKQIYCEAYEAYLKTHAKETQNMKAQDTENEQSNNKLTLENNNNSIITENVKYNELNEDINEENTYEKVSKINNDCEDTLDNAEKGFCHKNLRNKEIRRENSAERGISLQSSNKEEDASLSLQSRLWSNSAGLMLYSVPHRGSSLADIKTPITARSVELMEISKDNALVLSLQRRWAAAAAAAAPVVRSLVETRRTLMAVLWLRIVSEDSADPGIGALCGVSVDHREICKPSSRRCLLYTELRDLIQAALDNYHGRASPGATT